MGFILAMMLPALAPAIEFETVLHMELDCLTGEELAAPADFLAPDALLCLVLWDSNCPDCLENVVQLDRAKLPEGVHLLGVNFDTVSWDAEDFLASRRPTYPQLHDPQARLALALDAADFSFSFAILDNTGAILAIQHDSVDDAALTLRQAVTAIRASGETRKIVTRESTKIDIEPSETPQTLEPVTTSCRYPLIKGSGRVRTRALSVSLSGKEPEGDCDCSVAGPFGESLRIQKNLLYRFSYELRAELAPGLSAGAKLRISNEDPILFEQGPEYLSNSTGSAYVALERERLSARLGYFTENFTPLTLQRWDFHDNPSAAGSGGAGCGVCGGSVRGVSLEALDDLGPGITFEGIRLEAPMLPGLRATGFYAIPQRAVAASGTLPDDSFAYRLDLLGMRLHYAFGLFGNSRGKLSLQHLSAHEDGESSPLPPSWAAFPMSFIHKNEVWSARLSLALMGGTSFAAETAQSFERVDRMDALGTSLTGDAKVVELSHKPGKYLRLSAAWLKLGPDFASPYSALSYRSNAEGYRFSTDWHGDWASLSIFHKRLERIEDIVDGNMPERASISSVLLGWKARPGLSLDFVTTVASEDSGEELCTCDRWSYTLSARWELARGAEVLMDISSLVAEADTSENSERALIATLQMTADF